MFGPFAGGLLCLACEVLHFPYGPVMKPAFLPTAWGSFALPYAFQVGAFFPDSVFGADRPEAVLQSVRMDEGRSLVMIRYGQPVWWGLSAWVGFAGNTGSGENIWGVGLGLPRGRVFYGVWKLATLFGDTLRYGWGFADFTFRGLHLSGMVEEGGGFLDVRAGPAAFRWWRDDGRVGAGVRLSRLGLLGIWVREKQIMPWVEIRTSWLEARGVMLPASLGGYFVHWKTKWIFPAGKVEGGGFVRFLAADTVVGGWLNVAGASRWLWGEGKALAVAPPEEASGFPYGSEVLAGLRYVREAHDLRVGGGVLWMGGEVLREDRLFGLGRIAYDFADVFWLRGEGGWGVWLSRDARAFPDPSWFTRVEVGAWIAD